MIVNTSGSCLAEQVGQETVLAAKVETSTECKRTEDMLGGLAEDRTDVVVEPSKSKLGLCP